MLNQFIPLSHHKVEINEEQIDFEGHYIYLGQHMETASSKNKEVQRMIALDWMAFEGAQQMFNSDLAMVLKEDIH